MKTDKPSDKFIRTRRGTTLVSVIVAAAILAIALAMATTAFVGGAKLTRQTANYSAASAFAEAAMERERAKPFVALASHQISQGLPKLGSAAAGVRVVETEPGLKQVTVTCSWDENGRMRRVEFRTLVAKGGAR